MNDKSLTIDRNIPGNVELLKFMVIPLFLPLLIAALVRAIETGDFDRILISQLGSSIMILWAISQRTIRSKRISEMNPSDNVTNQVERQVRDQVEGQVRRQVWNQVGWRVWDQVEGQVRRQVWRRVWDQVRDQVLEDIENETR